MGAEALEKVSLYWLCHLPEAGALQIRRIGGRQFQRSILYRRNTIMEKRNFKKRRKCLSF